MGTLEVEEVKESEVHKEVTYRYIELLKDGLNQILCGGARCQELIVSGPSHDYQDVRGLLDQQKNCPAHYEILEGRQLDSLLSLS